MELDPRFCGPASSKRCDEVTVVELDQSWQSYTRSPKTFIDVNKPLHTQNDEQQTKKIIGARHYDFTLGVSSSCTNLLPFVRKF